MIKKALKKIQTIYFCLKIINWKKAIRLYDKNADVILWYYPLYRKNLFTQSIERDFAFVHAFIEHDLPFKVYLGENIGKFFGKKIFFSNTKYYEGNGLKNYTMKLFHLSQQLEEQHNIVYPTSHETLLWENKIHMHEQFQKLEINEPKTIFIDPDSNLDNLEFSFPCLLKEPHSSSSMGLYKISSKEDLKETIKDKNPFSRNGKLILQEMIDMRKDLRAILVGDKILLHYWRINLADEWRPTATGYGSDVDFISFPEEWRTYIIDSFKKLNITSGGFDITWQNDDLKTEPVFLEVSPFYQPNPKTDMKDFNFPYGAYKKKFLLKNPWEKKFVQIVFELQIEVVKFFLEKHSK